MSGPRLGVTVPFDDLPLQAQAARYAALPGLGYTDVWSSEADGIDAFTPLALAGAWAPSLRRGTAIIPAFTRAPAVVAQTVAALCEASPGGFTCGIGASSPVIVERWNGVVYDRPLDRTRDLARFLRRALRGEKVVEAFETFAVDGFRLARPPDVPPPILIAGLRPAMLRLAAQEADGAIINWFSASDAGKAADIVRRDRPDHELVARILVAPTEDIEAVRALVRRLITAYLTVPAYAASQRWLGRGAALAPMWEAWDGGDRTAALALVPDSVVDELVVHGSPQACRRGIQAYVDNGVTTPVVAILPLGAGIDGALADLVPVP